jgi:hypothetical protein
MTARLSLRPTLMKSATLILVLSLSSVTALFTPGASARTRTEVQLGDPDIGDQGPAPAPHKTLAASGLRLTHFTTLSHRQWRLLIEIALTLGIRLP